MGPSEVIVQVECTGDGRGKVQDEMREHHDISFHPDNSSSQLDIRLEKPMAKSRREFGLEISRVPGHGDGRLKVDMLRIVEGFQLLRDGFVLRVVLGWDIFEGLSGS
jgi:hypothetical protein